MIARAPDATVFLSTASLITGIFLTVVAAAFAQGLPERLEDLMRPAEAEIRDERYARLLRATWFILLIANTFGTLFSFTLLLFDTVRSVQYAWIWVAFSYLVFIIFINLGAVSTIYLGPFLVRRRRLAVNSSTVRDNDKVLPSNPRSSEATNDAFRHQSTLDARWYTSAGITVGIVIGFLAGIHIKRTSR